MIFNLPITTPPNTPKDSPLITNFPINFGKLSQLFIQIPWGCGGLVGIRVEYATWPLFPLNRNSWLIGNDTELLVPMDFDIDDYPKELTVVTYNEDDTYEHTPVIAVIIFKKKMTDKLLQLAKEL